MNHPVGETTCRAYSGALRLIYDGADVSRECGATVPVPLSRILGAEHPRSLRPTGVNRPPAFIFFPPIDGQTARR